MKSRSIRKVVGACACTAALGAFAPLASAACSEPVFNLVIPDGQSASPDEMTQAQQAVNKFVTEGEAYISCVEEEEGRLQYERLRDAMLDQMEQVAAQFNRQLRFFRRSNS